MLRHSKIPGGITQSELRHAARNLQPAPDSTGVASEILRKVGAAAGSPAASSGVCFWFLAFDLKQCESVQSVSSVVRFCVSGHARSRRSRRSRAITGDHGDSSPRAKFVPHGRAATTPEV